MVSAHVTTKDLELLSELIEAGKVRPQIDRRYPFAEIPAAIAYLEQGHARGKVVAERGVRRLRLALAHRGRMEAMAAVGCRD